MNVNPFTFLGGGVMNAVGLVISVVVVAIAIGLIAITGRKEGKTK
jgi:hypothetical protein